MTLKKNKNKEKKPNEEKKKKKKEKSKKWYRAFSSRFKHRVSEKTFLFS
jgi:hypothetical protein